MKFYIGVSCNKISFSRVFAPTHRAISGDSLREGEAGIVPTRLFHTRALVPGKRDQSDFFLVQSNTYYIKLCRM